MNLIEKRGLDCMIDNPYCYVHVLCTFTNKDENTDKLWEILSKYNSECSNISDKICTYNVSTDFDMLEKYRILNSNEILVFYNGKYKNKIPCDEIVNKDDCKKIIYNALKSIKRQIV